MEEMMPLVYDELRRIAASKLRYERPDHALSPTMLVHETWLEVSKLDRITWQNRSHYLAIAVQAMRRILIDYAVARKRQKRGGGQTLVPIQGDVRARMSCRSKTNRARSSAGSAEAVERASGVDRRVQVSWRHDSRRNGGHAEHLDGANRRCR